MANRSQTTQVKILMLARTVGDWWERLLSSNKDAVDLLYRAEIDRLPELEPNLRGRVNAYREAVSAYARAEMGRGGKHLAASLRANYVDRAEFQVALTLHMAALADVLDANRPLTGRNDGRPIWSTEDRILAHEKRYWRLTAESHALSSAISLECLIDVLAAATLCGARDRVEADLLLHYVPRMAGKDIDARAGVLDWVAALYPPLDPSSPWGNLQPDRLAAFFVGHRLQRSPNLADALVPIATTEQLTRLLYVYCQAAAVQSVFDEGNSNLKRLCLKYPEPLAALMIDVAPQIEAPQPLLTALGAIAVDAGSDLDLLEQLSERIPGDSSVLAHVAVQFARRIVDIRRARCDRANEEELSKLAFGLHNLGVCLGAVGELPDALAACAEAVRLREELILRDPESHRPALALSLSNLSVRLHELDRWDEGVDVGMKAVDLNRALARSGEDERVRNLAASLHNLAINLWQNGQSLEDALHVSEEATEFYRELYGQQSNIFSFELALCFATNSSLLQDMDLRQKALDNALESVSIYQALTGRPDKFDIGHLTVLGRLSKFLWASNETTAAMSAICVSVTVARILARVHPAQYQTALEDALEIQATIKRENVPATIR